MWITLCNFKNMNKKTPKRIRTFSSAFKKEKVEMLENGTITPTELRKIYKISFSTVYRWKKKYGTLPPNERVVIEKESEGSKSAKLLKQIKALEAMVGRKHMEVEYYKSVISEMNNLFNMDAEKKFKKMS